jgi:hypothetical protein
VRIMTECVIFVSPFHEQTRRYCGLVAAVAEIRLGPGVDIGPACDGIEHLRGRL